MSDARLFADRRLVPSEAQEPVERVASLAASFAAYEGDEEEEATLLASSLLLSPADTAGELMSMADIHSCSEDLTEGRGGAPDMPRVRGECGRTRPTTRSARALEPSPWSSECLWIEWAGAQFNFFL